MNWFKRISGSAWLDVTIAVGLFTMVIVAPFGLQHVLFGEHRVDALGQYGDYLGGIASWITHAVTVALLIVLWLRDKRANRVTDFNDGLLRLIELYEHRRDNVLAVRPPGKQNYFTWLRIQVMPSFKNCTNPNQVRQNSKRILEENYDAISGWRIALFRIATFINRADVDDEARITAMRLLRASCEREEQRLFLILLFERGEGSKTARLFVQYSFWDYADLHECQDLSDTVRKFFKEWIPESKLARSIDS